MKTFSYSLELYTGIKIISPVSVCIFLLIYVSHVEQHCPKNVFLVKQKLHRKLLNLTLNFQGGNSDWLSSGLSICFDWLIFMANSSRPEFYPEHPRGRRRE